jgi:hypothetical protein
MSSSNKARCPLCNSVHLSTGFRTPVWGSNEEELHVICNDCALSVPLYSWESNLKTPKTKNDLSFEDRD